MEPVITLLTCVFATFCAVDGSCTDRAPMQVTLDFGDGSQGIRVWTDPRASGRGITAEIVPPLPSGRSQPLHLLARSRTEGAMLVSLRADARDDTVTHANLRLHPDQQGNPGGDDVMLSEAICTLTFVTQ